MRPSRIAFIGQRGVPATIGGIEHHVEEIGSRLVDRGHDVTIYARANYTASRITEYRGMRVRYIPTAPTKHLEALVHSGFSTGVAMLPGGDRADILHYHAIGPSVFTPIPRALTRRGVVLTIHGLDYERDKWGLGARTALKTAGWISARVPHAIITVSKNLAAFYLQRYGRVAHYIPNGVAPPVCHTPHLITERFGLQGGDYVLFLGRLVPEKAPDLLVRAFRNVDTTARLVIAGGSSFTDQYVHELEVLAARDPRVLLVGPVHGELLQELYTNAAMFVLPSRLEGLALTLLEAASYRLPLVVSDIPPNREVIGEDGPGGRMFASGDERGLTAALAVTLADLSTARAGAKRLGDRVVGEYDWDAATTATEVVYEQVLHRASSSRTWGR
jgi:glycosyltransferase involved in cell wall biosynthesis